MVYTHNTKVALQLACGLSTLLLCLNDLCNLRSKFGQLSLQSTDFLNGFIVDDRLTLCCRFSLVQAG